MLDVQRFVFQCSDNKRQYYFAENTVTLINDLIHHHMCQRKDHQTHSTMISQKNTDSELRVTAMTCLRKPRNSRVSCYT